jgi:hypothetical protein
MDLMDALWEVSLMFELKFSLFNRECALIKALKALVSIVFICSPQVIFLSNIRSFYTERAEEKNEASNNSSTVSCIFVAAVTFLPSRYLATMGNIDTDTDC